MTQTTNAPATKRYGAFVWHEYTGPDTAKAMKFYADLLGWKYHREGDEYPEILVGEKHIGGFFKMEGAPSGWYGYVSVEDVDATAAKATAAGGKIHVGPKDIPHVGRFAVVQDPQGAVFAIFRGQMDDPPVAMPGTGEVCWNALGTTDVEGAKAFYTKVLGWTVGQDPQGAGTMFGEFASVDKAPEGVPAHWLVHLAVADLAASRQQAEQLGGKVLMPKIDIPYGSFAVVQDPCGGVVSLFEPKRG